MSPRVLPLEREFEGLTFSKKVMPVTRRHRALLRNARGDRWWARRVGRARPVVRHIFSYLNGYSLRRCRGVCKLWEKLARYQLVALRGRSGCDYCPSWKATFCEVCGNTTCGACAMHGKECKVCGDCGERVDYLEAPYCPVCEEFICLDCHADKHQHFWQLCGHCCTEFYREDPEVETACPTCSE